MKNTKQRPGGNKREVTVAPSEYAEQRLNKNDPQLKKKGYRPPQKKK